MEFLDNFSDNTKVWVYQSPRPFSLNEQEWILSTGVDFVNSWNAHGSKIKAEVHILENRFLVIASDQAYTANSGCSIDSMVRFVKSVQEKTGLDLMDRMLVYYQTGEEPVAFHFHDLGKLIKDGVVDVDTLVFNPLVDSKLSFNQQWKRPLKESWLSRFAGVSL